MFETKVLRRTLEPKRIDVTKRPKQISRGAT
jgi:hypothetical protein